MTWLERRTLGFGASDVGALLLICGHAPDEKTPKWLLETVKVPRGARAPRLLLEKAGLVEPREVGATAQAGNDRERELLEQWKLSVQHEALRIPEERLVRLDTVAHADSVPREWLPLVDRHCPRLIATPDAWARDVMGDLVDVQLKCSVAERTELPWYYRAQIVAETAVMNARWGLCVLGERWAAGWGSDGPLRAWPVGRDEALIATIRADAIECWARVEELRDRHARGDDRTEPTVATGDIQ